MIRRIYMNAEYECFKIERKLDLTSDRTISLVVGSYTNQIKLTSLNTLIEIRRMMLNNLSVSLE